MSSQDDDQEIARMLAMTVEELRAFCAARGLEWDGSFSDLDKKALAQTMEKLLFGAPLDDIMGMGDLADLEIRPVGFSRRNEEPHSSGLEPPRPRRTDVLHARDAADANIPVERVNADPPKVHRDGEGKK
jgi:hypothetical protein